LPDSGHRHCIYSATLKGISKGSSRNKDFAGKPGPSELLGSISGNADFVDLTLNKAIYLSM